MSSVKNDARENNIEFTREKGDFWAYNYLSIPDAYWTGYFSTQPDFKRIATVFSDFAKFSQLITATNFGESEKLNLSQQGSLMETLSLM